MALGEEIVGRIERLASVSESPGTLTRVFLTAEHRAAAELLLTWMREAGMSAHMDAIGNVVGRYEGASPKAPALLLVAENDVGSRSTKHNDTVALMQSLEGALKNAGRDARMIVYPPYPGDGHQLFSTVGSYWNDVVAFLKRRLT